MSEAQVIEKSHVWFDAWDNFDAAEHVYQGDSIAIFIGHAIENLPAFAGKPAATQDGYNTVVCLAELSRTAGRS